MTHARPTAPPRGAFIPELNGMRGLALAMVVAFHLFGNGRISGGVDVFLVISAFLLTGSLFRGLSRDGRVSLLARYSTTFARLIPSALVVLLFVAAATVLVLPESRWPSVFREIFASALYFENWELIQSQLAYGAAGTGTSPLQHFWSLSVQGQFFVVWPLVMIGLFFVARRARISARVLVTSAVAILTGLSFAYATAMMTVDQEFSYLSSFSRFWELGAGALAALLLGTVPIPRRLRIALVWVGCALVLSCGFVVDGARTFPGPWALWPVLGIILVIFGSGATSRYGLDRVLDLPPLRFLARISYPLYLWHWPLLIFYLQVRDYDAVGWRGAAGLLGLSVVLAWITQRLVEQPTIRFVPRLHARTAFAAVTAVLMLTGVTAATAVTTMDHRQEAALLALSNDSPHHPGALALAPDGDTGPWPELPRPAPVAAERDIPVIYEQGCIQDWRGEPGMDEVMVCEDDTVAEPRKTVLLTGGSHVVQWYPALRIIADQQGWELVVVEKGGCRFAKNNEEIKLSRSCASWNDKSLPVVIAQAPEAVITVGTETHEDGSEEVYFTGQVEAWRELDAAGIPVIALRDTPRFGEMIPECLQKHTDDVDACGRDRDEVYAPTSPLLAAPDLPASLTAIDMSDHFCTAEVCAPIVGNVVVYRDDDHMTATYARTLTPALLEALRTQVPWLF